MNISKRWFLIAGIVAVVNFGGHLLSCDCFLGGKRSLICFGPLYGCFSPNGSVSDLYPLFIIGFIITVVCAILGFITMGGNKK